MIIVDPLLDFEFICKEKSDDIYFKYNKPKLIKTVLKNDFPWEGECNGYYSIIKDNNNIYKLYYRANKCSIRTGHEESTPYNLLCVALSVDGINFEKPKLDIVLNNTNIILKDDCCSNICPIYLPEINTYFSIGGVEFDSKGIFLYISENGIYWNKIKKIIDSNSLLKDWNHINHFDSLNTLIFDKYSKKYLIYVRHNQHLPRLRQIQYTTTTDFNNFTPFNKISFYNEGNIELYTNHIIQYPYSPFYIGFPTIHDEQTFKKFTSIMFSRDGIKWTNPKINFFVDDISNMCVYNFVEDPHKQSFYIYRELLSTNEIECYAIEKDKLGLITSNNNIENYFTIELILKTNKFFILTNINKDGYVFIEIYDKNNVLLCASPKIINTIDTFQEFIMEHLNINNVVKVKIIFLNAVINSIKYDTII